MEFKSDCVVTLDKGTQKVKCFKFKSELLNRELALHEDTDNKSFASVSDIITGFRLFGFKQSASNVTLEQIDNRIEEFVKRYTLDEIDLEFKRIEGIQKK